jgi:MoaA/NifB/PqqE/SkfB family radical SAM enzyme
MVSRDPIATELPRELYIEVTNRCNSHCQACVRTFRRPEPLRDLTLGEFQSIVDQFPALERVVLHGIGEPLLNAELPAMICAIKARFPSAAVLFNSNAVLLNASWRRSLIEAGLDEYRVSLDGATAATYARIRGLDAYDRMIENLHAFVPLARDAGHPRLSFWLTAMRENLDELPALVDLAADIGIPEVYVQRLVLTRRGLARQEHSLYGQLRAREEAALAEAARRAQAHEVAFRASGLSTPRESLGVRKDRRPDSRDKPWSACFRMWRTTYVTANGNVMPCCISPFSTADYAGLVLGNVFESPFVDIWNGPRYVERRTALHTGHPLHPCEGCGTSWSL